MELANAVPWRFRLAFRRALTTGLYSEHYDKSRRLLERLGVSNPGEHLIERPIKGVGPSLFNARCIEARTVPGTWEQLLGMLPMQKIKTLADIGCGQENPGRVIDKMGVQCAYSDIEHFQHIPNFTQMNFNDGLRYADKEFDYAVCVDVIEHVENTRFMVRELRRISKLGFVVATPNPLSKRSLRVLNRTGYFEWFAKDEVTWHINPVFHFQMQVIADELGMDLAISGNTCFFADHDPVENAEALIYRFSERS